MMLTQVCAWVLGVSSEEQSRYSSSTICREIDGERGLRVGQLPSRGPLGRGGMGGYGVLLIA